VVKFDRRVLAASNYYVRPQPVDEISADPRTIPAGTVCLMAVVLLLAALLAGAIIVALHYRTAAAGLRQQLHSASVAHLHSPPSLVLSARTVALPASGPVTGEVTISSAQLPGGMERIVLSARMTGGRPYTRYALIGNDCVGSAVDHPWAAGVTDGHGLANLIGHPWAVSRGDEYWLWLSPSPRNPGPGLHGSFTASGGLSAFPAGNAPCAPG
jgi:hypothetical protein